MSDEKLYNVTLDRPSAETREQLAVLEARVTFLRAELAVAKKTIWLLEREIHGEVGLPWDQVKP